MKTLTRIRNVAVALVIASVSMFAAEADIVIDNVTVISVDDGQAISGQQVIVSGDRIIAVGAKGSVSIPEGARFIDGSGKYLIPGFAEMHGHIPPPSQGAQAISDTLFLYLSNGVTTVRGMLGSDGQLELRRKAMAGEIASPTLYLAGPSFNGNSVSSPTQAQTKVSDQVAEGWDLLKIHPGLTRAEYDAMDAKADELGIEYGGHIPADVGLIRALETKQRTIDHVDGYIVYLDGAAAPVADADILAIVRKTKDAGVGIVPTQALWRSLVGASDRAKLKSLPELKYISKNVRDNWFRRLDASPSANSEAPKIHHANRQRILKVMADEGVEILFGTDAPQIFSVPGFSIHHEIKTMLDAGMTPSQILASGTSVVGDYFSEKDTFGRIAAGNRADLVLLNGNPLENMENLQNPAGVMHRGNWLSREDINRRLSEIEARHK